MRIFRLPTKASECPHSDAQKEHNMLAQAHKKQKDGFSVGPRKRVRVFSAQRRKAQNRSGPGVRRVRKTRSKR